VYRSDQFVPKCDARLSGDVLSASEVSNGSRRRKHHKHSEGSCVMKKILIVALMMVGVASVTVTLWPREQQKQTTPTSGGIAGQRSRTETQTANHNHESMARVRAHYGRSPLNTLRGTLAPEMFTGNVQLHTSAVDRLAVIEI
jgi:hypothetical protein